MRYFLAAAIAAACYYGSCRMFAARIRATALCIGAGTNNSSNNNQQFIVTRIFRVNKPKIRFSIFPRIATAETIAKRYIRVYTRGWNRARCLYPRKIGSEIKVERDSVFILYSSKEEALERHVTNKCKGAMSSEMYAYISRRKFKRACSYLLLAKTL